MMTDRPITQNDIMTAILAMDVYNRGSTPKVDLSSITKIGNYTVASTRDGTLGFNASYYTSASGNVLSYRGTDVHNQPLFDLFVNENMNPLSDLTSTITNLASWLPTVADGLGGFGLAVGSPLTPQGIQALQFYADMTGHSATGITHDMNLTITGQSLGGGIAGFVAMVTGNNGIVYENMPYVNGAVAASALFALQGNMSTADAVIAITARLQERGHVESYAVSGEFLQALRLVADNAASAVVGNGPTYYLDNNTGHINPFNTHSQALMTLSMFGETQDTAWKEFGYIGLYQLNTDNDLASHAGINDVTFGGVGAPADRATSLVAYSLIPEGIQPFGTTAAYALFNDMADIGHVTADIKSGSADWTWLNSNEIKIARVIGANAAWLATHAETDLSARQGVVSTDSELQAITFQRTDATAPFVDELIQNTMIAPSGTYGSMVSEMMGPAIEYEWGYTYHPFLEGKHISNITFIKGGATIAIPVATDATAGGLSVAIANDFGGTIQGGAGDEIVVGGAGDDDLSAGAGTNVLLGGDGSNILRGGAGNDRIIGGSDADLIIGSGGNDDINGGGGNNILTFATSASGVHIGSYFTTYDMSDHWWNGDRSNYSNIQEIRGSSHDDLFEVGGWGGIDYRGGSGNDVFRIEAIYEGTELHVDGGSDEDTLNLSQANDWGSTNTLVYDLGLDKIHYSVTGGDLYIAGFEHIDFGLVSSVINGTYDNDIITSGNGNSTVVAGAGNDVIHGGTVQVGTAANVLSGNLGNDIINAAGAARIYGGSGNDIITGSGARDFIDTGFKLSRNENGVILDESDNDIVDAGGGNDVITGLSGNDRIEGGAGISDEFDITKSNSSLGYSLLNGMLLVSCGSDTALLSGVENIRISDPNSYAPDLVMKVSDIVAQLVQKGAAMTGTALVAALQQDGKSTEDKSTIYANDYDGMAPGGGTRDIDGNETGGVTYENKTGVTMTVRDYVEPGHVATITGTGINNKIYNAAEIVGSGNADRFDVAGHQWPALGVDGAGGYDILTFASSDAGVTVDTISGTATGVGNGLTFKRIEEIHGSALSDTFYLQDDQIIIYGGGDSDTADFSRSTSSGLELTDDRLHDITSLIGTQREDTFKFIDGVHSFTGGGGYDTVTYDGATSGITIAGTRGIAGAAAGDTYHDIFVIIGTASGDRFSGTGAFYKGGGGSDEYIGGSGGSFDGGGGTDTVSYANVGAVNLDAFYEGTMNNYGDYLRGVERFVGSAGNDVFADGYGEQYQQGVRSGLTFEGQGGSDSFTLAWGSSALGGVGDDVFTVIGSYNETTANLYGGSGYDLLIIKDGAFSSLDMQAGIYRTYNGRAGEATGLEEVWAPWGTVYGTGNSDVIKITTYGGTYSGDGIAYGGGGNDILSSDIRSVAELHGGAGNDLITSLGYDKLFGDADDDTIYGGSRTNQIWGGSGNDTIYSAPRDGSITEVRGGDGVNHIYASGESTRTEVHYDFTKSMSDNSSYYGDGGGLISARDLGGVFEVITTQGTDYVSGVANLMFSAAPNSYGWVSEAFYLAPGLNYYDGMFH